MERSHDRTVNKVALKDHHGEMANEDILFQLPEDPFGMDRSYLFQSGYSYKHECNELQISVNFNSPAEGGSPHDALFFVLDYLTIQDLLSIEGVCRSLRDAVRGDPYLWRSIRIAEPLNVKITDKALVQLINRAQGTLGRLILVNCPNITDNGLRPVVETNPKLSEIYFPGCRKLTAEGMLSNLRASKSASMTEMKLRFGLRFDVKNKPVEELRSLLKSDNRRVSKKPLFFCLEQVDISFNDNRAIDIEVCPKCQKLSLVYDCPSESCQRKCHSVDSCRACLICIARCSVCGRCIEDCCYKETFDLKNVCLDCFEGRGKE